MRLRECVEEIGVLEARHGRSFEEFSADWVAERVKGKHWHALERDYMEWDARLIERRELLDLIREITNSSGAV